jgi:hypothetical protein
LIFSVKGVYHYETYGYHPVPFALDIKLSDYIVEALAADVPYPPTPVFKPMFSFKKSEDSQGYNSAHSTPADT